MTKLTDEEKARWAPMLQETYEAIASNANCLDADEIIEVTCDANHPEMYGDMTREEYNALCAAYRDPDTQAWCARSSTTKIDGTYTREVKMNFLDYKRSRNIPDGISPLGFKVGDRVKLPEWQDTPNSEVCPEEIGTVMSVPHDQSESNINRNMIVIEVDPDYRKDESDDGLREVSDDQVVRLTN